MLLEYQLDWIKIVDFLLIAKFWASLKFACTPSSFGASVQGETKGPFDKSIMSTRWIPER